MSKGPKCASQRAKTAKNLRGGRKEKRFKVDSEKQAAYHLKIQMRRARKKNRGK